MSCATSIYRYLNEDKIAIYNDNRNIRDILKYNLDEEYRERMREKARNKYYKKVQKLEEETINEYEELIKDNDDYKYYRKCEIDIYSEYLWDKLKIPDEMKRDYFCGVRLHMYKINLNKEDTKNYKLYNKKIKIIDAYINNNYENSGL
jgi:hypothetical protein